MPGPVRFLMPGALGCNVIGYNPLCRYLSAGRNLKKDCRLSMPSSYCRTKFAKNRKSGGNYKSVIGRI